MLRSSALSSSVAISIARLALASDSASSCGVGSLRPWIQKTKNASAARNRAMEYLSVAWSSSRLPRSRRPLIHSSEGRSPTEPAHRVVTISIPASARSWSSTGACCAW